MVGGGEEKAERGERNGGNKNVGNEWSGGKNQTVNEYTRIGAYTKKQAHLAWVVGTDIGEAAEQHNHLIDATHTVPSLRLEVKPCGEPGTMHNHGHKLGQGDSVNFHENEERTGSALVTSRRASSVPELCPEVAKFWAIFEG